MAVLPIRIAGDPVLHAASSTVTKFDSSLRKLVDDLFETMRAAPGVGLAAPQVGVPLRVFVFDWTDDAAAHWRGTAVNPELWISPPPLGDADPDHESEGCLSLPGARFPLRRAERAILRAVDLDAKPFEVTAEGWLARIFQHEFDHLDGVIYADRLDPVHARGVARLLRKKGWGVPEQSWMPGVDLLEKSSSDE